MNNTSQYSTLFQCIYDQPEPIGNIGRGCHYSIFRSVERFDVELKPALPPHIHDFAVIWDEDHDTRVIEAIECLYMSDLLAPVQFIGERKGTLTVIIAARAWSYMGMSEEQYQNQVQAAVNSASHGDFWPVEVGMFDRSVGSPHQTHLVGIIAAKDHQVDAYLRTIDTLWRLGTRPWTPGFGHQGVGTVPPLLSQTSLFGETAGSAAAP